MLIQNPVSCLTSSLSSLSIPVVIGMEIMNETMSASGCAICMPHIPIRGGRIRTIGMRIIPWRANPSIDALHIFPVVWRSMLLIISQEERISVKHLRRSAIFPISMTSGSPFLKNPTIGDAHMNSMTASTRRTMERAYTVLHHSCSRRQAGIPDLRL